MLSPKLVANCWGIGKKGISGNEDKVLGDWVFVLQVQMYLPVLFNMCPFLRHHFFPKLSAGVSLR